MELPFPFLCLYCLWNTREQKLRTLKQDGFVQMSIAKIQPQPAKMPIVVTCISSGEVDLALIAPKFISLENKTWL
jgi:hypothetical protein